MITFFILSGLQTEQFDDEKLRIIQMLYDQKQYQQCIQNIKKLIDANSYYETNSKVIYTLAEVQYQIQDFQNAINNYIKVYKLNQDYKLQSHSKAKRLCLYTCSNDCNKELQSSVTKQYKEELIQLNEMKVKAMKKNNLDDLIQIQKRCSFDQNLNMQLIKELINQKQLLTTLNLIQNNIILPISELQVKNLILYINKLIQIQNYVPQKVFQTEDSQNYTQFDDNQDNNTINIQQNKQIIEYYSKINSFFAQRQLFQNHNGSNSQQNNQMNQNQDSRDVLQYSKTKDPSDITSAKLSSCQLYKTFTTPSNEIKFIINKIFNLIPINKKRLIQSFKNDYKEFQIVLNELCQFEAPKASFSAKYYEKYKKYYLDILHHQKYQNFQVNEQIIFAIRSSLWIQMCFYHILLPLQQEIYNIHFFDSKQILTDLNDTQRAIQLIRCNLIRIQNNSLENVLFDAKNLITTTESLLQIILQINIAIIQPNFNAILEVSKNSTTKEIRQNYETRINQLKQYKSNKRTYNYINMQMTILNEAYKALTNPTTRQQYYASEYKEAEVIQLIQQYNQKLNECK